ncbi:hypothetical protein JOM56_000584 [Amanita muscaria]
MLQDLPLDILREIFRYCDAKSVTEISSYFASIANSIPSLWSTIRIGQRQVVPEGPDFLSYWLNRAGTEALQVSIEPLDRDAAFDTVDKICHILSNFNYGISRFEISTETAMLAGTLIGKIFPSKVTFSNLLSLSIRVEDDEADDDEGSVDDEDLPRLDKYLTDVAERFPSLQTFSLPTFYDSLPMVPKKASFSHLHTLILDGALERDDPSIILVVALLHSAPQLETLWFKHVTSVHYSFVPNDPATPSAPVKGDRTDVRGPVFLPSLTSLAVSAPGCALDIILSINAPALHSLHIDGSRGPVRGDHERYDIAWDHDDTSDVLRCLKRLSLRSKQLRRLAITSAYIPHADWKWLLFGTPSEGLPFPLLESIALHDIDETPATGQCGFNDALLTKYAQDPRLPLRRLAILRCNFLLSGAAVAQAFKSGFKDPQSESYELDFGPLCPQVVGDELEGLAAAGVKLIRRQEDEAVEDTWWTRGHSVDPFDLHAY